MAVARADENGVGNSSEGVPISIAAVNGVPKGRIHGAKMSSKYDTVVSDAVADIKFQADHTR